MRTAESLHDLAALYFDSEMPHELEAYLIDRYNDEPLEGAWDPQQLAECVQEDIQAYLAGQLAGQLDTTVRTPFQKLEDRYHELSHLTSHLADENRSLKDENDRLMDFLLERNLTGEYAWFKEHANLKEDQLGLMHYAL